MQEFSLTYAYYNIDLDFTVECNYETKSNSSSRPDGQRKTAMAITLASQVNGEIVSADSRLVYKGFNIAAANQI